MEQGTGMFRGVQKDAAALGKSLGEILKKLFAHVVPDLYPKLEMGARPLKGDEAEQILKAADLKALPGVFYAGDNGLGLVVKDGAKNVVNTTAEVAKEVLDYLKGEHNYGNKEQPIGKALEKRFGGIGYGWEQDMLRLVLAALFRAGRDRSHLPRQPLRQLPRPAARTPFTNNPAFHSSLFSPRQSVGLKTLTRAVQQLEDLTGEEVDVEEGAIADGLQEGRRRGTGEALPAQGPRRSPPSPRPALLVRVPANADGHSGVGVRRLRAHPDRDRGHLRQQTREKVRKLCETLNEKALGVLRQARRRRSSMAAALLPTGQRRNWPCAWMT